MAAFSSGVLSLCFNIFCIFSALDSLRGWFKIQRCVALQCSSVGKFFHINFTTWGADPVCLQHTLSSCLMPTASDTLASRGLTSSTLDLYKTAERDRSAVFVLFPQHALCSKLHDTLVLWNTDTHFYYIYSILWSAAWRNSNLLYWTFNEIICCYRWSRRVFFLLFYCIFLHHQIMHFIWLPWVLPFAVVSLHIKWNQNVMSLPQSLLCKLFGLRK